MVCKRM